MVIELLCLLVEVFELCLLEGLYAADFSCDGGGFEDGRGVALGGGAGIACGYGGFGGGQAFQVMIDKLFLAGGHDSMFDFGCSMFEC